VNYVTDAHALLWHLYWPKRLGNAAQQVFANADAGQISVSVPAVVVAEAIMVVQKGRLPNASLDHLLPHLRAMAASTNYPLSHLLPETVIASHQYTIIPDIFDRLIVTETISRNVPLITRDPVIQQSGLIATIWN
jgi:PIN domain nuclease of toxin-antitoxin system